MKKTRKLVAVILAVLMLFSATGAYASSEGSVASDLTHGADTVQNAQTAYAEVGIGTSQTDVYLTIDNRNLVVGVPTTIILNSTADANGNYIGRYSLNAHGDIAGNLLLHVEPESSTLLLTQSGKSAVTANMSQAKTVFDNSELLSGVSTQGTVEAAALSAGSWSGSTNLNIYFERIMSAKDWKQVISANNISVTNRYIIMRDADNYYYIIKPGYGYAPVVDASTLEETTKISFDALLHWGFWKSDTTNPMGTYSGVSYRSGDWISLQNIYYSTEAIGRDVVVYEPHLFEE